MKKIVLGFSLYALSNLAYALEGVATKENQVAPHQTVLDKNSEALNKVEKYPNVVNLYRPNYILPYYHTTQPYYFIYTNQTPNNQPIKKDELSAQLSFLIPIYRHVAHKNPLSLNFAYTQNMFWQVYTKSAYFRETNYEPELFLENYFNSHFAAQVGVSHQSNGRGGIFERSWNRLYLQGEFTGTNWLAIVRGWGLVGQHVSSDLHNPDIAHYLGYEYLIFEQKVGNLKAGLQLQNIESGFKRGFQQITLSYPILKSISIFCLFFNGYGQSLIEYDHKTTSVGIGLTLNDWIN